MKQSRLFAIAFAISSIAAFQSPALAQSSQAPTVTDSQVKGDWTVRCIRAQQTVCVMAQIMVQRERNARVASVEINYVTKSDAYLGRFGVPLGVAFDQGLGLEVGAFRAAGLKYRICERDGCYVTGVLPQPLVEALKNPSNDKGFMDIQMIDGRKLQIPIQLSGFSDALDLLKKWTIEKASPPADKK